MSAKQFQEALDFERMESPETRMDVRFSLLAGLIAISGGLQTKDGKPYTSAVYLDQLQDYLDRHDGWALGLTRAKDTTALQQQHAQHVEYLQMHIDSWVSGVNTAYYEKRGVRRPTRLALPTKTSRELLAERRGIA